MKKFLTKIFLVLLIAVVFYGGYYAYTRWREQSSEVRGNKDISGFLSKTVENVSQSIEKQTEKKKQEFLESVGSSIKNHIQEKTAEGIFWFGEKIQSLANVVAEKEISSSDNSQSGGIVAGSLPAALIIKINIPLFISVQGSTYSVDWGDGKQEKNSLLDGQKLINHSWSEEGDYFVRIEVVDKSAVHMDSFPVRVTNQ